MTEAQSNVRAPEALEHSGPFALEQVSSCPLCDSKKGIFVGRSRDDRFGYPGTFEISRCDACGLSYLRTRIREDSLQELYTRYYQTTPFSLSTSLLKDVMMRALRPLYPDTVCRMDCVGQSDILEIGPGARPLPDRLSHRFENYRAVEFDGKAIGELRRRFGETNVFSSLQEALDSVMRVPVTCCVADQVLEHMYHPIAFLSEIGALVGSGTTVILSTPNTESRYVKIHSMGWTGWHVPYHVALYNPASMRFLAEACGFKIVNLRSWTPGSWLRFQMASAGRKWPLFGVIMTGLCDLSPFHTSLDGDLLYCCLQKI